METKETKGVMLFNRGDAMVVGALATLYSLRKHWDGNITMFLEEPFPKEFQDALKFFNCKVIINETRHDLKTLVRKNSLLANPPYDKTLWLDIDTVVTGKIDPMFDFLDEHQVDMCIPHFCGWKSSGHHISKRINRFRGLVDDKYIEEALKDHPAINTGVLSFRKSDKWKTFIEHLTLLADKGSKPPYKIFIPDETIMQIFYPSMQEWGLKYFIAPTDYNVSVMYDHGQSKDPRIHHFHGNKNVIDVPNADIWKSTFEEMRKDNIANINDFLKYADKRLKLYLEGKPVWKKDKNMPDTTIVTAIDQQYLPILKETFINWRRYKNIDAYPVMVFVNGIDLISKELEFLRLPNVTLVPWDESCMDKVGSHRELMLSAFIFGTAKYVKTDYWLKLDADSYATDYRSFITEEMKKYAFFGHKWSYSKVDHIKQLDEWRSSCWHHKIKNAPPMINEGRIDGDRFFHNKKRTISFIQLHKTRFTKYCVKLFGKNRLPAPTQDTTMFYILDRLDPSKIGTGNFKKDYGFTQGNGRMGAENIKLKLLEIDNLYNNEKIVIKISEEYEINL